MTEGKAQPLPFLPARKNRLVYSIAGRVLVIPQLKRAFGGVYVRVERPALQLRRPAPCPVIVCATHSGWWDGHMAYIINERVFHHDGYMMMDNVFLKRLWFFTYTGIFGIDRDDPRKIMASMRYITHLLQEQPNRALWVFPQGTMRHPDARPIAIYGGAAGVARRLGRCVLVPVALRYDFFMEQYPVACACIGSPIMVDMRSEPVTTRGLTARIAEAMTRTADRLREDVVAYDLRRYRRILSGRRSIDKALADVLDALSRMVCR
jgi:hypothetical protein